MAALAAAGTIAGLTVGLGMATASAASTADPYASCEARALGIDGGQHFSVAQVNGQTNPCVPGDLTVASAKAKVLGLPLIPLVSVTAGVIHESTSDVFGCSNDFCAAETRSVSDVAKVKITIGLTVITIDALHSVADVTNCDASGWSTVANLRINGHKVLNVNGPVTIKLPLGLLLNLNQQVSAGSSVTQRAISLTSVYNDVYRTVISEAVAGQDCED